MPRDATVATQQGDSGINSGIERREREENFISAVRGGEERDGQRQPQQCWLPHATTKREEVRRAAIHRPT